MSVYKVRLINSERGLDETIEAPDDQYILDIGGGTQYPLTCWVPSRRMLSLCRQAD